MIVDLFCGGGGASEGIRMALGVDPDFAVNHNAEAIAMHEANHASTVHFQGDVWHAAPRDVTRGRPVSLLWMSPTCTHFSQAKGGPLKDAKERSLAWVGIRWAREAKPDVICLENVPAFETWGRLDANGKIEPKYRGHTFKTWVGKLKALGYRVDMRKLRACDYGAPTTRERLYLVARRDSMPIVWPHPTHGRGLIPHRAAAECMDWSIPGRSIFGRSKALALPTLRRIARALNKHVLSGDPYIVPELGAAATLIQTGYGEREGQAPRALDIRAPLGTAVAGGVKHALVTAVLVKNFGGPSNGGSGVSMRDPLDTITCQDHHSLILATLVQYNGQSRERAIRQPLGTVTTHDRFGLIQAVAHRTVSQSRREEMRALLAHDPDFRHQLRLGGCDGIVVDGQRYEIGDVLLRMLKPRELATAQGFGAEYVLDPIVDGKRLCDSSQVRMIGNSVVPQVAAAIVRANVALSSSSQVAA
jgi:DNA (cytosine-5)-methyltransferase 1